MYAQRLDRLFSEVQSEHSPVFGLAYCCFFVPYDFIPLLSSFMFSRSTSKFKSKNPADWEGPFFFGWRSREFYAVPKTERLHLNVGEPEWCAILNFVGNWKCR